VKGDIDMSEPKPVASLSPTLLARKGTAKPAMRPQITPLRQFPDTHFRQNADDLGWNDMGHEPDEAAPVAAASVVAAPVVDCASGEEIAHAPAEVPHVVRQQQAITARIGSAPPVVRRSALADGRRAAFTLRLDSDRHLKLRLACAVTNRSAQQIVTEALDRLIAESSDVAELAAQLRKRR
jgi:hypothetical protein